MADRTGVWLDCDPGHDDAFALILAGYAPTLRLLGVSTVHGNVELAKTTHNAQRVLGAAGLSHVPVVQGASKPLTRPAKACPEVHGDSGLDVPPGCPGLPDGSGSGSGGGGGGGGAGLVDAKAINFMFASLKSWHEQGGQQSRGSMAGAAGGGGGAAGGGPRAVLVATGPLTNVALLLSVYPEVARLLHSIVFMGGAVGMGNTRPASEFNIELDPEAAKVVVEASAALGIPLVMVPLEVTHTALATPAVMARVLGNGAEAGRLTAEECAMPPLGRGLATAAPEAAAPASADGGGGGGEDAAAAAGAATPFRAVAFSLLRYFAASYRSVFFMAAPPLHDPCAVFFAATVGAAVASVSPSSASAAGGGEGVRGPLSSPFFHTRRCRVEVETASPISYGRTLVDLYGVGRGLGSGAPSSSSSSSSSSSQQQPLGGGTVSVALSMDVPAFWAAMLEAIAAADAHSPLNAAAAGAAAAAGGAEAAAKSLWAAAVHERHMHNAAAHADAGARAGAGAGAGAGSAAATSAVRSPRAGPGGVFLSSPSGAAASPLSSSSFSAASAGRSAFAGGLAAGASDEVLADFAAASSRLMFGVSVAAATVEAEAAGAGAGGGGTGVKGARVLGGGEKGLPDAAT